MQHKVSTVHVISTSRASTFDFDDDRIVQQALK